MQLGSSFWGKQKVAALNGVADYDYAVGLGYDQIPSAIFGRGFHTDDHAHENALGVLDTHGNVPRDPQNLYSGHNHMLGGGDHGLHAMDPRLIALDLAPIMNNQRLWQIGNVGDCIRGMPTDLGFDMPYSVRVTDVGVRQMDAGNPVGAFRDLPHTEIPAQGKPALYRYQPNFLSRK